MADRSQIGSALHHNITMEFLDCSPPGLRLSRSLSLDARCNPQHLSVDAVWTSEGANQQYEADETGRFHNSPLDFLRCAYGDGSRFNATKDAPSHLVVFDEMATRIVEFLDMMQYHKIESILHAHLILDGRTSKRILIYERQLNRR
jgi:hypothetical protein